MAQFCPYCGEEYSRREHLERHITKHTGVKPHRCPYCCLSYSRKDLLQRHISTYHEPKEANSTPHRIESLPTPPGQTPIACQSCASAKTGCDKLVPCSRCQDKRLTCVPRYARRSMKAKAAPRVTTLPPHFGDQSWLLDCTNLPLQTPSLITSSANFDGLQTSYFSPQAEATGQSVTANHLNLETLTGQQIDTGLWPNTAPSAPNFVLPLWHGDESTNWREYCTPLDAVDTMYPPIHNMTHVGVEEDEQSAELGRATPMSSLIPSTTTTTTTESRRTRSTTWDEMDFQLGKDTSCDRAKDHEADLTASNVQEHIVVMQHRITELEEKTTLINRVLKQWLAEEGGEEDETREEEEVTA